MHAPSCCLPSALLTVEKEFCPMKIVLIYLLFATFFVDQVFGPVGLGVPGLSLFNLNIYLLLMYWVVLVLQGKRIFLQPSNLNIPFALIGYFFFLSIFIKLIHAEIPNISILREIIWFKGWLDPVLLFLIIFNILDNKRECNNVLLGLCLLFFALLVVQLSTTFGIYDFSHGVLEKSGRAGGLRAPGEHAIALVLFLPFVLSAGFLSKKGLLVKTGCIILAFLFLLGIVNAGSRNGAVSLCCCIVVYLILLQQKKVISAGATFALLFTMITVAVIAFLVSPENIKMEIEERFNPTNVEDVQTAEDVQKFTSGRSELWKNGWRLFVESPLWGHGRNSYAPLSKLRGFSKHAVAHNEYIKHLAEYGIIGFFLYMLIRFKILQNIWGGLERASRPWEKLLFLSYMAGLLGYMVGIFFTNAGPSTYIFWFYTGIMYKYVQLDFVHGKASFGGTVG